MPTRLLLEGPEFEPLLAQVREEHGPDFRIVSAEKVRSGGLGGFFARQRYELSVELPDPTPASAALTAMDDSDEPVDTWLALIEASQDRYHTLPSSETDPALASPTAELAPAALPPRAGLVSTNGAAFSDFLEGLRRDSAPHPSDLVPATSAPAAPALGSHVAGLVALGVPAALAARATDTDPYRAAVQAMSALPAVPELPTRPGDVLVVAGELAHALPIARAAAQALHLDPSKVLLAGPSTAGTGIHPARRISGPAEAIRRARRMHRAEVPYVVVVDAPLHGGEDGWVRSVCDGLGATRVWAAVDATRKLADTRRHLDTLGGVDAVAVYSATACADPASVLQLGQPVALLDGQPAEPHAWAALLGPSLMSATPAMV